MTSIRHTLQQEVFQPNEERLIVYVHVTNPKTAKKKKISYLCASLSTERPIQAHVYQVKKADKGEQYKKKLSWSLRELKVVDGKDTTKETCDFELHFEKQYKWTANTVPEKEAFITCLWKLSQRYVVQKPEFQNVPKHLLEEVSQPLDQSQTNQAGDDLSIPDEDYQALSSKEEADLDLLMSECKVAISNAEAFAEQLFRELSVLDWANIHSIMGSEDQVYHLMRLLDEGIDQATRIEERLDSYDNILKNVKDQMEVMKDKDTLMNVRNTNHQSLLDELNHLVTSLDLDLKHYKALLDGDLSTPAGIYECTAAADALHKCVNADLHEALRKLAAVEEQQRRFSKIKQSFAKRLAHHLNNIFIQQGNEIGETLSRAGVELKLPQHHSSHRDLTPYAELMLWLKSADIISFHDLAGVYTQSLNRLYVREMQEFMETAKQKLMTGRMDKGKLSAPTPLHSTQKLSGSSSSLGKPGELRGRSSSLQSVDSASISHHSSDSDLTVRQLFDQILEKVLCELEPFCLAEQDFCVRFFHLTESQTPSSIQAEPDEEDNEGDIWMPRKKASSSSEDYFVVNLGEGLYQKRSSMYVRHINEGARKMMGELFPNLESELEVFIAFGDRLDGFNSMYMLVRMSQHVINTQHTGSFLSMTFASCLVKIKRSFDKFVQNQITAIGESKVSKSKKCGIISFVHQFEEFANQAETIFKGSDRHTDLEKNYTKLVSKIYEQIFRVASEHQKTPKDVVLMENFHRMFSILSQLKIRCLETERGHAKQIYADNLYVYTAAYMGRPLEKIHTFFDGVRSRVASGVKKEEVGYQLAFSKQELRKVIKEYPAKELKKGLHELYKKMDKHLCAEENLLQVVWHTMQDEFIKQYKQYDDLINECYPGSMISLEFTMEDVLQYFSDIAQSH